MPKNVTRLFNQFQPETYDLHIRLDRTTMKFQGSVRIAGRKSGRPSQRLTFHQKGLTVTAATILYQDKKGERRMPVVRINHQRSFDEVRIHSNEMLYPGTYSIELTFEAPITPGMTGIYPCYYKLDGQEMALIATQFESHHAREAFPCIDEPEAKAVFNLSLSTEKGITVLGNTPIANTQDTEDGIQTTVFKPTPRMSSYLLAFVAGDLHRTSGRTRSGIEVSIWATKAQPIESLDFALDAATRSIDFFEEYFGVSYPLAKADHVALPDFSSGAMENWGLITYRERVLLAYPGETSQSIKETIATVVAHETSHQWFGNLVTMRWWDDLWLNESFANMMEYQAVDALYPDWNIWDTFISAEGLSALRRDASPGVQAVRTVVNHPDEISTLFDPSIVYAKGGRLLYMLKNYIGEDAFRSGLTEYFKQYAYKNTEGSDLWAALSKTSGKDIAGFMNPWLERSGFPVLTISQKDDRVTVGQEHFSDNPEKADKERIWPVPLFASSPELGEVLNDRTLEKHTPASTSVRVNVEARGHYIVNYPSVEQRSALTQAIISKQLSSGERLMVLNDSSMLARAGYQSYGSVLELMSAYNDEASDPVWDILSMVTGETRRFIDLEASLEPKIKAYIRQLIAAQYQRLGWDQIQTESAADQKLRATIIGLGAYADDSDLNDRALQAFAAYQKDPTSLSTEIRAIVFGVPIKQGDTAAFDYLLHLHDTTQNSDLKADIASALTVTRSEDQARLLLGRLKDPKLVKPQDADRWLVYMLRSRYVRNIAWQWMVDEWDWIEKTYKNDKSYDYMPRYAASACNTQEWLDKYRSFFEPKLDQVVLKRNILIGVEEIENRVKWLNRDIQAVEAYFSSIDT